MSEQSPSEMAFAKEHQASASPMVYRGGLSQGTPDYRLRKAEVSLRVLACLFSIGGFVFLITDHQSRTFQIFVTSITQEATYSGMKALVYSIVSLGIVALYSLLQLFRCLFVSNVHPASALAWTIFLLDQVMTYFLLTSSSASSQSAYFSEQGNNGFQWQKVCYLYEHFCKQVGMGIICSFVAFMALVFTSVISAFKLFASGYNE